MCMYSEVAAGGMSDHFIVEGRVKVSWKKWMRNERNKESE